METFADTFHAFLDRATVSMFRGEKAGCLNKWKCRVHGTSGRWKVTLTYTSEEERELLLCWCYVEVVGTIAIIREVSVRRKDKSAFTSRVCS